MVILQFLQQDEEKFDRLFKICNLIKIYGHTWNLSIMRLCILIFLFLTG